MIQSIQRLAGRIRDAFPAMGKSDLSTDARSGVSVDSDIVQHWISIGKEFTPEQLNDWRIQARAGYTRPLYSFYDEMKRFGLAVQASKLRENIRNSHFEISEWPIQYADRDAKGRDAKTARAVANYFREQYLPNLPDIFADSCDVLEYGVGGLIPSIIPRGASAGFEAYDAMESIPPRHFRFDMATNRWQLIVDMRTNEYVDVQDLVAAGRLVFLEVQPRMPIDQRGLLFPCIIPWGAIQYGFRWWCRYLEIYGIPFRMGTYPAGDAKAKANLEAILRKMGNAGYAALPKGSLIDFPHGSGNVSGTANTSHQDFIAWAFRSFDQIYHGHDQNSGVQEGTGSKNSAQIADIGMIRLTNGRLRVLANLHRRQTLRHATARNFGTDVAAKFTPIIVATARQDSTFEIESQIVKNLVHFANAPVPVVEALKRCGYRMAKDGEAVLGAVLPTQDTGVPTHSKVDALGRQVPPTTVDDPADSQDQTSQDQNVEDHKAPLQIVRRTS